MNQGSFQFRLPWWFWVGVIGMVVFGGWRGFFGAIAGVIVLPIILFAALAAILIVWALISGKRFSKFPPRQGGFGGTMGGTTFRTYGNPHQHQQQYQADQEPPKASDIIETEATVIKRED